MEKKRKTNLKSTSNDDNLKLLDIIINCEQHA